MFRFVRMGTVKNAALFPEAMMFSQNITMYLNEHYDIGLKFGAEMFGSFRFHWSYEAETLADIEAINTKLMEDKEYWSIIKKGEHFWVDGSMKDTIIHYM